jgi:Fe-S-cluster containining protein
MFLELNLNKIRLISESKEEENFAFRSYLKGLDSGWVDNIVHRLNDEISAQIDCRKCGNCCLTLRPCVTDSEIGRLAKIDRLNKDEYIANHVEKDDEDDLQYLKEMPCKYLEEKVCTIYYGRPEDCRSYPHTHKADFTSRTLGIIDNYAICPIVFNVYEYLKQEIWR